MENKFAYYFTPVFRLVVFLVFVFLCFLPSAIIVQFDFVNLPENSLLTEIISQTAILVAVIGALFMCFETFPTIGFQNVFVRKKEAFAGFLKGSLIGIILIGMCAGLLWLLGAVEFSLGKITALVFFAQLLFFLIVAFFEELMFRTFPLYVLAERYPMVIAISLNSMLFGVVHLSNPSFNWLGMLNISLAGVMFCIYTLQKKNISWAIGIHFTWNFTQGILLGYKVSGTDNPGVLVAKPLGNIYLSGGAFGVEGSIICTAVLVGLIIFLWVRSPLQQFVDDIFKDEPDEEFEKI